MAIGPVFERAHHRRIGRVLESLDPTVLHSHRCWFAGGTAIALRCGEYRESIDVDFVVADLPGYRQLRQMFRGVHNLSPLTRRNHPSVEFAHEARIDQYGIRALLKTEDVLIKFEIVSEGRIDFDSPTRVDQICGVATLTLEDLAACKLLANMDRWRDDSVFARDAIDLAMLDLPPRRLKPAIDKAVQAYGSAVLEDLQAALRHLRERPDWLSRCMQSLSIKRTPAFMQQQLRQLSRRLFRLS